MRSMSSSTLLISSYDCLLSASSSFTFSSSSFFSAAHAPHISHGCKLLSSAFDWPLEDAGLGDTGLVAAPRSSVLSIPLKNTFPSSQIFPSFLIIGNHPSGLVNANRIFIDAFLSLPLLIAASMKREVKTFGSLLFSHIAVIQSADAFFGSPAMASEIAREACETSPPNRWTKISRNASDIPDSAAFDAQFPHVVTITNRAPNIRCPSRDFAKAPSEGENANFNASQAALDAFESVRFEPIVSKVTSCSMAPSDKRNTSTFTPRSFCHVDAKDVVAIDDPTSVF